MSSRRDPTQDASQAVASGIFQINTAVSTFQRLVNTLGTPKDTPELREKLKLFLHPSLVMGPLARLKLCCWEEGHKTRLHIGQVVKDTSAKLKQASETDHRTEVSASKKITDAKLAKDFQAVLKEFQKAQRLAAERETAYAPLVPQAVLPSSYTASEIAVSSDKSPEQRALLVESRSSSDGKADETCVKAHQEEQRVTKMRCRWLNDIGANIEGSHAATAQGKSQLNQAAKTQKSNSSLALLWKDPGEQSYKWPVLQENVML
ncbi:hypothetical protein C3L33_08807, partial [Rhododendron williamsianum]